MLSISLYFESWKTGSKLVGLHFFRNVLEGIILDIRVFIWINLRRTTSSVRFRWVEYWISINRNSILQISEIYCKGGEGSLLHTVQMATPRLYKDSKTFVDKPLKTSPDDVLKNFDELMKVCSISITKYIILLKYLLPNIRLSWNWKLRLKYSSVFRYASHASVILFQDFLKCNFSMMIDS